MANGAFSGSSAAISAEIAGKTFEYIGGSYVPTDRTGAPANGVRFLLYAINPVTMLPAASPQEVGYVELTDLSGSSTQGARVVVVSEGITYLNYTVAVSATPTSGQMIVTGFVTDGTTRANINFRATLTETAGLTLLYSLTVPERDVSISLTMTAAGLGQESGTISIELGMSGPNGTIALSGQASGTGSTLTVRVNGASFATITSSGGAPLITGSDGQPLSNEDVQALQSILEMTGAAFTSPFDVMVVPVGFFVTPVA
jgi:hypothetical protein